MPTRRNFLGTSAGAMAAALASGAKQPEITQHPHNTEIVSLCGEWSFRIDPENSGTTNQWYETTAASQDWRKVVVPHTWQIETALTGYRGIAWYWRSLHVPLNWHDSAVRVEFEGVFHSATVWVNGQVAGEHARKGYTAFTFDITQQLRWGGFNSIAVRVDNAFNRHMLPRGDSSDWANDGGIFRPVQLLIAPKTFIERLEIEAEPDFASGDGRINVRAFIRNIAMDTWNGMGSFCVSKEESTDVILESPPKACSVKANAVEEISFQATLPRAKLWHFDHPNLYRLEFSISGQISAHCLTSNFGFRKFEIKNGGFYLNCESVRLMGVERMAGSNPEFGMAEPTEWITHDHSDMKRLNCVFTRVHWPQDKRVLDYCDRHGILMQSEIPAWGWATFEGMTAEPDADILENGLEQLREMISRDRNHPSVLIWGLCNEIAGQNPPAYEFAKRMLQEAKRLDPNRLCAYASNSLGTTPQKDVASLMDIIETNEYYGTWAPGTVADAARHFDDLHRAFPGKPVVVSEYGYCACTPDRPEGDTQRMETLRSHDVAIRSRNFIGGAIFFCYNDYRTHVGDRGTGVLQQRVHGVVDIYGNPKLSYELLCRESSPIESVTAERQANTFRVQIKTRGQLPMYILRGYTLRVVFFGEGNIPVEQQEGPLPDIAPGTEIVQEVAFKTSELPHHVLIDVLRPTSFSTYLLDWRP